jgi:hypothetical protein
MEYENWEGPINEAQIRFTRMKSWVANISKSMTLLMATLEKKNIEPFKRNMDFMRTYNVMELRKEKEEPKLKNEKFNNRYS